MGDMESVGGIWLDNSTESAYEHGGCEHGNGPNDCDACAGDADMWRRRSGWRVRWQVGAVVYESDIYETRRAADEALARVLDRSLVNGLCVSNAIVVVA